MTEYGKSGRCIIERIIRDKKMTDLFELIKHGDFEGVKKAIENGADVNARNEIGWTPLHLASYWGCTKIAKLLIENKADVNAKDVCGNTPLHLASRYNNLEIVKLLIEKGADVNAKDNYSKTALDIAKSHDYQEIIDLLTKNKNKIIWDVAY